jgi:hypothetical protein
MLECLLKVIRAEAVAKLVAEFTELYPLKKKIKLQHLLEHTLCTEMRGCTAQKQELEEIRDDG